MKGIIVNCKTGEVKEVDDGLPHPKEWGEVIRKSEEGQRKIEISKNYIKKSYKEGHYVEAIVLTHYIIEVYMNITFVTVVNLFIDSSNKAILNRMITQVKKRKNKLQLYPITNYKFLTIANILFDMGIYSKKLFIKLKKFNTYRNIVTHRVFEELPTKKELDNYFSCGMKLWDEIWQINMKYQKKFFDDIQRELKI